eukprot:6303498-Pyramimonas_sp.AAC.1
MMRHNSAVTFVVLADRMWADVPPVLRGRAQPLSYSSASELAVRVNDERALLGELDARVDPRGRALAGRTPM